jgi:hypothetical protein
VLPVSAGGAGSPLPSRIVVLGPWVDRVETRCELCVPPLEEEEDDEELGAAEELVSDEVLSAADASPLEAGAAGCGAGSGAGAATGSPTAPVAPPPVVSPDANAGTTAGITSSMQKIRIVAILDR